MGDARGQPQRGAGPRDPARRGLSGDALRLFGTGLLGAYTTFSTWMLESHRLGEDGRAAPGLDQRARQPRARPGLRVARRPDRRGAVTRRAEADDVLRRARPGRRSLPGRCAGRPLRPPPAAHEPRAARRRGLRRQAPPAHRPAADALRGPADRLGRGRRAGAHRGAARRGRGGERRRARSRSSARAWPTPPSLADARRGGQAHRLPRPRRARGRPAGAHRRRRRAAPPRRRGRHRAAGRRRHRARRAPARALLRRQRAACR